MFKLLCKAWLSSGSRLGSATHSQASPTRAGETAQSREGNRTPRCPWGTPHGAAPEAGEGASRRVPRAGAPEHAVPARRAGVSRALPGQPCPGGCGAAGEARQRLLLHGVGRSWWIFVCCHLFRSRLCPPASARCGGAYGTRKARSSEAGVVRDTGTSKAPLCSCPHPAGAWGLSRP